MVKDYDILYRLYIEKMAGTISQEELVWLEDRLEKDSDAKQTWERLEREGDDCGIQKFIDNLQPQEELAILKSSMLREPRNKPGVQRLSMLVAAAIILVLVGVGVRWIFFRDKKITDNQTIASLVKQNKNTVHLQMASGNEIDLQDTTKSGQLKIGNTTLNIDNNKLGFSSTDTALNLLSIPQGENYTINLSDGTSVTLNAESKLRFPFKFVNATREVYLEGEGYFKVAKDSKHPFIVHTPLTKVEVLGTEFNVNTYKKGVVSTALIEGKVRTGVMNGEPEQVLSPGHAAIYNTTKGFNIETVDTDDVVAWMKGIYYFHDLFFRDLSNAMSRIYGVDITFDDTSVENKSVSGVMDKNNLPELLEDLKSTAGIKYYYSGKKLHIY